MVNAERCGKKGAKRQGERSQDLEAVLDTQK
jgi:hypothetical protein